MAERARGGRIFGLWSPAPHGHPRNAEALGRMAAALGPGARALGSTGVIADADACTLEGRPVDDFGSVLDRLPAVTGAFALAWRTPGGELRLAADAVGHRSLYYARAGDGTFVFASALSGVLASGLVPARIDRRAIASYLSCAYVPGPRTLLEGVSVLPPGCELVAGAEAVEPVASNTPLPAEPATHDSVDALRTALREQLEHAVQRALPRSGEPLGATLSGGIDSSLVLALARRLHQGELHAYSVSFGPGHANELEFSAAVAQHLGLRHTVVEVTAEHVARHFDATVAALSIPNGDPLTVPNLLLFQRAAFDTAYVLNGEGGDPCFGGPKNAPMLLGELLGDGASEDRHSRARRYLRAHQKCYDDLADLLAPELAALLPEQELERTITCWLEDPRWRSLLNRLMALNIAFKGAHHILPKVAELSFAAGICPRSPLFDAELVRFSFQIPAMLKRRGAVEKYLLKEAVRELLPASVVDRPKSGMLVPVEAWFRGPLRQFARERLLDGLAPWNLCQRRWLEDLVEGRSGALRPRRGVKLWLLLTLEAWLRQTLGAP